jgi:hypothetical protein
MYTHVAAVIINQIKKQQIINLFIHSFIQLQLCSVRKYLTNDGHRWFDVGCLDSQVWLLFIYLWLLLTPLSEIFQLYRGGQFYWWGNRSTRWKPPTCRKSPINFISKWPLLRLCTWMTAVTCVYMNDRCYVCVHEWPLLRVCTWMTAIVSMEIKKEEISAVSLTKKGQVWITCSSYHRYNRTYF